MKKMRGFTRFWFVTIGAWTLVALAWTPPTILVSRRAGGPLLPWWGTAATVFLAFMPWMAATPTILWLSRRWPVMAPRLAAGLAVQLVAGVCAIPMLAAAGATLTRLTLAVAIGIPATADGPAFFRAVLINGLYSVPTYIAVVCVGQSIAYFEHYRAREHMLAHAQLRALRAQLNPHFLFNALNGISALGYRDPALADQALTRLSELLRSALLEQPQEIMLKVEIVFMHQYLDLQNLLAARKITVELEVDTEAWTAAVPAMLLQPLVENAVLHGLASRKAGGRLRLSARRVGERLRLGLENDGPDPDAETAAGGGLGQANVRERLKRLYGAAQTFEFTRSSQGVAIVTLELPFRALDEDDVRL
jgi:two-component system sensor histidine kinase AlgZ